MAHLVSRTVFMREQPTIDDLVEEWQRKGVSRQNLSDVKQHHLAILEAGLASYLVYMIHLNISSTDAGPRPGANASALSLLERVCVDETVKKEAIEHVAKAGGLDSLLAAMSREPDDLQLAGAAISLLSELIELADQRDLALARGAVFHVARYASDHKKPRTQEVCLFFGSHRYQTCTLTTGCSADCRRT